MKPEVRNCQFINLWHDVKISDKFLRFIAKNVECSDDFLSVDDDNPYYSINLIETIVEEKNFILPKQDNDFFEVGRERKVDYVQFYEIPEEYFKQIEK